MKPSLLFAPGAGAPSTHPWMQKWKERLETIGEVALFDYDYMREGRNRPDPPPQLIAAHRRALAQLREKTSGKVFLIGKSMGGRIGCHVSLEEKVAILLDSQIRTEEQFRRTAAEIAERDKVTDQRIGDLVSAIGALISEMREARNGKQ